MGSANMTVSKICFVVIEVGAIPLFSSLCESLSVADRNIILGVSITPSRNNTHCIFGLSFSM